jgi:ribosomal protein S18 acetylase RimI-like enzyme
MMAVITFRDSVRPRDEAAVAKIISSSGFFNFDELRVAVELVGERLVHGLSSGYHFIFIEDAGNTVGYSCFGPIPMTRSSWDLYWIAIRDDMRGGGFGRMLMRETEKVVKELGGTKVYADTSSREQYTPTRAFYEKSGYAAEAVLADYYAPGDSKAIYSKSLKEG